MLQSPLLTDWQSLPKPADRARAESGVKHWLEAAECAGEPALAAFARDLAGDAAGLALLMAVFGNSPFLSQCLLQALYSFRFGGLWYRLPV
jgi:glutamate-ammonia-ligase adenylyltransferase